MARLVGAARFQLDFLGDETAAAGAIFPPGLLLLFAGLMRRFYERPRPKKFAS